jgi:uracil-DNA glycosylase family 4
MLKAAPIHVFGRDQRGCTRCPLHEGIATSVGLGGVEVQYNDGGRVVVIVMSKPEDSEEHLGEAGHGRNVQLVQAIARKHFPKDSIYLCHAVRCHSGWKGSSGKLKDPPAKALKGCHKWLRGDLRSLGPDLIIPIGSHAIASVLKRTLKDSKPLKMSGTAYPTEYGCNAVPVQSPAWALFDPESNGTVWERTWAECVNVLDGVEGFEECPWRSLTTREEVTNFYEQELLPAAGKVSTFVAYDYETKYLDLTLPDNDWRCVSYTLDGESAVVVPLAKDHWTADLHTKFLGTGCAKSVHNSLFEIEAAIRFAGVEPQGKLVDTKLLAYLDNENRSVSLDFLTAEFLPDLYGFKKASDRECERIGWENISYGTLAQRNAHDAIATWKLARLLHERLAPETRSLYTQTIERGLFTVARMKVEGWQTNRFLAKKLRDQYLARVAELDAQIRELEDVRVWAMREGLGVGEVKLTSRTDHLPRLLSSCGIETGKQQEAKTHLQQTGAKLLKPYKDKHPIVPLLLDMFENIDLAGKFCEPILRFSERDGMIHPGYNIGGKVNQHEAAGTVTLRLSSKDPNVMNYPEDVLGCFVSRFPGGRIMARDYSQLELRVMTQISEDPVFLAEFQKEDADPHQANADAIAQVIGQPVDRHTGKTVNFMVGYGGGAAKIAEELGCSEALGKVIFDGFWSAHPSLKRMFTRWRMEACTKGVIEGMFGQNLHVPDAQNPENRIRQHALRRSGNFPIQNGAAVLTLGAMWYIDHKIREAGLKSRVIAQLHDAIYVDVFPGEEEKVRAIMVYAMEERPFKLYPWWKVPIPTDEKLSRTMKGGISLAA